NNSHSDRQCVSDRSSTETLSSPVAAAREELSPQQEVDNTEALQSACCTALTELSLDDTSAHHIVQENGVYIIAKLISAQTSGAKITSLQCYAFRTLRFLFRVERNRHLFKRLFPTDLFEMFIDVGHCVRDLAAYEGLQTKVSLYTEEELDNLRESVEAVDQNRPPLRVINGYSVLDHLGTGAFGSVFKVRKQSGQNLLALKEVNLHNSVFGKDKKSRDSNVEKIISELTIVKEQAHVFNLFSFSPKASTKPPAVQSEELQTDLASGTVLCKFTDVYVLCVSPEVVKNEPYGEKADIWALGCILYQMATLHPPFYSSNMLSLANKIVEADYEPVEEGAFSERVTDMIRWCQSPDAEQRPDVVAVSSRICDLIMKLMDGLYTSQNVLERRAERDRKRAQKYFLERHTCRRNCCLSSLSQETALMQSEYPIPRSSATCSSNHSERIICPVTPSSCATPDQVLHSKDSAAARTRARPVSAGICVSQKKLRQIVDPSQRLLGIIEELLEESSSYQAPNSRFKQVSIDERVSNPTYDARKDSAAARTRARPVSAGICVSQKKLRQIVDPSQRLLVQLHKIVYISQLPPAPHHNIRRRVVERFKKSLFHYGSDPYNLKVELSKVCTVAFQFTCSLSDDVEISRCTCVNSVPWITEEVKIRNFL
ncbi:serine/threonine-protein kinase Nek10-like, partial [Hippoglossus hippoglossus]|uniref:serine/threonine-protein kinase Nek10-like n=1 Tax=Hippoglossus hippoglossus TaxID=8267 RepID=UPI00148B557A